MGIHYNNVGTITDEKGVATIYHNGKELPPLPGKHHGYNVTQIDDKVYVNGYEWMGTQWKRTLAALWHWMF